jgi:predicted dehydrogenase
MSVPRILIVGAGSIGERHVRCFLKTSRCAIGICETADAIRASVADRYPIDGVYGSLDEAPDQPWDAAVIATPAHTHLDLANRCAGRGLHLLIEKPLTVDTEGLESLRDRVRSRGLVCAVAYVLRQHPCVRELRDAYSAGRIGRALQVTSVSGQHFPHYRPGYRETYYIDRRSGGGAVQDALTHNFDLVSWLIGPMTRLSADVDHQALPGSSVEDTVQVIARHGSTLTTYCLNQFQAPNELTLTLHGAKGSLRLEYHRHRWLWVQEISGRWESSPDRVIERDDTFVSQAEDFLDALAGRPHRLCPLDDAVHLYRAAQATLRSAGEGGSPQAL